MKLNKEQIEFLHKYTYGGWTLNEKTGLVDIKGNFYCNYSIEGEGIFPQSEEKLTNFKGVKFGVVTGNFYCSNNSLTSLDGAPQEVRGAFFCDHNSLTSLEGAPQWVGEDFYCSNNSLTSLEGAPPWVGEDGEDFDCSINKYFYCSGNPISEETLDLVWETMQEKNVDYWFALSILKSEIKSEDWKLLEGELDERISKDSQKGISMMDRFGHFD